MGIDRNNAILNMMYRGTTTIEDFNWDAMTTVPILYLMTPQDIDYIKNLILSPRYSGNNKYKMEKIDEVMHYRGFSRFAGGTNRLVYVHPAAPNAVFKVAIDSVGINDNPAEFRNQNFLKPYCCKVFECTPCGTIASFEKVDRITTFEEFYTIADDYYYIIVNVILGKYVMDDIGIDYFMNVGIRVGCYPVLLDFPYLFELDGRKLECCNVLDDGRVCGGEIDYDGGFNKLICKKCGRVYRARDLAKPPKEGGILLRQKGGRRMKLEITRGSKVIKTYDTTIERDYLSRNDRDVTNNRAAEVVLKHVEVKTKKVTAPVHHEDKSAHRVAQQSTPVITKRVVKEIDISKKSNNSKPEVVVAAPKSGIELNINKKAVIVPKAAPKKEQPTNTEKVVTGPKTEMTNLEKPIVGRVIDVSIDKPKASTEVVKADTSAAPSVEVCISKAKKTVVVETKKEEHINRINGAPIVKAEDNTPKKVKTVEVCIQETGKPDKNDRVFDEDTVKEAVEKAEADKDTATITEAYREMIQSSADVIEDIDHNSLHQSNMIQVDLTPSPKAMQQAIFFGDEPGGYDPNAEKKEEEDVTFQDKGTKLQVGQKLEVIYSAEVIDGDPDFDINLIMDYCNDHNITPKVGSIVVINHRSKNAETNEEEQFSKIYVCIDPENDVWEEIEDDSSVNLGEIPPADAFYDNSVKSEEEAEDVSEEEQAQYPDIDPDGEEDEEPAVEGKTDDAVDEDEEDEYQITLVDSIPSDDEAESDVFYCLPRHNRVDTSKLESTKNPIDIDPNEYRIFFKVEDTVEQIIFDYDNDSWVVMSDEPSIKLSSLDKDQIIFADSNELPEIEDAIADKFYLIKIDEDAYYAFTRDNGAKSYRFCFIVLDNDPVIEVVDDLPSFENAKENVYYALKFLPDGAKKGLYLKNVEAGRFDFVADQDAYDKAVCTGEEVEPEVETSKSDEQDIDEIVEMLKNSSKKKSLDDFMK